MPSPSRGEDDKVGGRGARGAKCSLRGRAPNVRAVAHQIDAYCKSHRLQVVSNRSAGTLAAAHNLGGCYRDIVALYELYP
eukprot:85698-Pyramimonas_sp.AAC.1